MWLAAFDQKKLCWEEAKRSEQNFGWRWAGRLNSFLEEWPVHIHAYYLTF